jgi:hypothetical protein
MASLDTVHRLSEHSDWLAPRSDVRVFLGEPGAPEATKTTVEPGNVFSPGMRTFGVTWWLRLPDSGTFFATETAPLEAMRWGYEEGYLPLINCNIQVEGLAIRHSIFQDGTVTQRSEAVCCRLQLGNMSAAEAPVQVFVALRSLGPAGGPVHDLTVGRDGCSFWLGRRNLPLLGLDRIPDAIGCGVGDPSPLARTGFAPDLQAVQDPEGWCFGLTRFDVTLTPGETWQVHLDCPQQTYGNLENELPGTALLRPDEFGSRARAHLSQSRARLSNVEVEVPDQEFRNAFYAGLQHMLTATVGDQARIAPLTYPLPWLRDSVYIIRCFDLAGLHDLARTATEYCVRNDFFGGFGAEGDAPGEGVWAVVQHYRVSRDKAWLERVYPAVRRKCEWLFRMRRAEKPLQVTVDTPVLASTHAERGTGVICLAAQESIIMGAMDHGVSYSTGWVNQWALCGLREAAYAARELGFVDDADRYEKEAIDLKAALRRFIARTPEYFEHERTVTNLLWPTRAWEDAPEDVRGAFDSWWEKHRRTDHAFLPEPYWLYFELAQAHNALLLGRQDRAWQVVEYRLRHQDLPGLYGWREGGDSVGMENVTGGVTLIHQLRGCQQIDRVTPHGWSQAEMWLLQRAMLVEEWQGGLLLFAGVPAAWLAPGARVAFRNLPTWYGRVSSELLVDNTGEAATVTVFGAPGGTPVTIRLLGGEVEAVSPGGPLAIEVSLEARRAQIGAESVEPGS